MDDIKHINLISNMKLRVGLCVIPGSDLLLSCVTECLWRDQIITSSLIRDVATH